jgi:preprotein translocase subunit Sec63
MQERMLREAAERVRLLNLARRPISSTPGIPVIDNPIPNIEERYPDHWTWKDPYARLGLPANANIRLVKSHWRHLARVYHPDKSNRPQTSAKFNAIAASFKKIVDRT